MPDYIILKGELMKSVGRKIFFFSIGIVCLSLLALGLLSSYLNYQSTLKSVKTDMTEVAKMTSQYVEWELKAYLNVAQDLGENSVLASDSSSADQKLAVVNGRIEKHGFVNGNFAGLDGNSPDGNNYSEREYFKRAMEGKSCITSPTVSKLTGELVMIFAAPITSQSEIKGVVFLVPDSEFLNDIMRNVNISEHSEGYILDSEGNTIAAIDSSFVINSRTADEMAAEDPSYSSLAACHNSMLAGESGFADYEMAGTRYLTGYAPIAGTDGWSLAIRVPADDYLSDTYKGIFIEIIFIIIVAVICGIAAAAIGTKIGRSVRFCAERIQKLADGDLKSPVPEIRAKDETGILAQATGTVVESLNAIIGDIGRILGAMANKNFNVHTADTEHLYVGDYTNLLVYLRNINHQLNTTLSQISIASDEVSSASDQVSAGAQSLAQGTTEQAASVEELADAIHTISKQVSDNSQNCSEAKKVVDETAELLADADRKMNDLTRAMETISEASDQINGIIKTLEDIVFQTNILALNAAVEAARVGEAGKGFAVVAGEVRNLASKSAESAGDISALIERSVQAVTNGAGITADTAKAVSNVQQFAFQVEALINKIASASADQASMVTQIMDGMDQVSNVVQTNSATAQESAAASQELSSQAEILKEEISSFTLREN